ncbi:MAG: ABC transporter, substrate-binding protein (cluster 4, leucine/isoleucine/valine/benzoate) [uncultured Acetobacteraceae bacterium]|jgi:branched-chain amino acid transport system substrate-binding protein|uniref:ABC transporter, substrate-binding protein (Cluster 4, leucine/isoleucine/valine/benzoate) n=1 Tax=uncultured Acetobacteraceae bacterium TaxID=169975 RepID=A0A6J4H0V3_9PROT|nr:MAG: ABC transporter, substrate-binding protein (cluster 4, leucine/isoleucine/valine/benzoate) [uncultured Acetobacteraceae bacterium]
MTKQRIMLGAAVAAGLAAVPAAAQPIPVGHLMDNSGATSDVGVPYGQGVADTLAWVNNTRGGVNNRRLNVLGFDYGYQAPRAVSQYQAWSRDRVVAIQGWGTADTEALTRFVTRDKIPYISGSYSAALTDAGGKSGRQGVEATPFNFFYGPSYSDGLRAMLRWSADDWKARGQQGRPKYVHMGGNHPYPNSPKEAGEAMARDLGFEVLSPIVFALTPGDYTSQCLTLRNQGANYAYLGNTAGSNISVLRACQAAGVNVQFLGNVWGMDENAMKAAGPAANGVVFPVRTSAVWGQEAPGMAAIQQISRVSDPSGNAYRPVHYLSGACAAMLMVEAMETAAQGGGQITGERIRDGFYARKDWVPKGFEGVCAPSNFTAEDHRGTMRVPLYRARVGGDTSGSSTVAELMQAGTMKLESLGIVELERKREWLGW